MTERKPLGEVLECYGRISAEDRERALAHQKENGGYFGEALVSLGLVSQEELDYSLAAQFDLPYVFPDPGSIDLDAARMVAPEWALAHRMLPIARSGDTLSVVADTPFKSDVVAELEARTGLEVELAITAAERIRELVLHVFGRGGEGLPTLDPAQSLDDFLDLVLASGTTRFGLSLRARRMLGWWVASGRVHRCRIPSGWPGALVRRLHPGLPALAEAGSPGPGIGVTQGEQELAWGQTRIPLSLRHLRTPTGEEFVFEFQATDDGSLEVDPPPASFIDEVQLLHRAGAARFLVEIHPPSLGEGLLPQLPRVLLGPQVRSVHVGPGAEPEGILHLPLEGGGGQEGSGGGTAVFTQLRAFHLDALTARVAEEASPALLSTLARSAGAVFVTLDRGRRPRGATGPAAPGASSAAGGSESADPAFGWRIRILREEGDRLVWTLLPASGRHAVSPHLAQHSPASRPSHGPD